MSFAITIASGITSSIAVAKRIEQATFDHPIILFAEGQLLDGFHRVAKAYLLGMNEIAAVQFEHDPEPDRIHSLLEWLSKTL